MGWRGSVKGVSSWGRECPMEGGSVHGGGQGRKCPIEGVREGNVQWRAYNNVKHIVTP